jgi:hypothetical protein
MAKSFSTLKSPLLALTDKLSFGKFKDCRLCDIIQDHYEYLIWAEKEGYVKYSKEVKDVILEQAHFERWKEPEVEEDKPITHRVSSLFDDPWDEDVPF